MTLAQLIDTQQEALSERWLSDVRPLAPRADLTRAQLLGSLPVLLGELLHALRTAEGAEAVLPGRSPGAEAHGGQRLALGYTGSAVAREHALLQELVLGQAAEAGVEVRAPEGLLLARWVGTATASALAPFGNGQGKALREELEVALASSEARLRETLHATGAGTFDLDVVTGEMHCDAQMRAITGLPAQGPLDPAATLARVHPEERAAAEAQFQQSLR